MENNQEASQNIKNEVILWPSKPFSGYLLKIFKNIYLQKYMHLQVHFIIHRGQDIKIIKVWGKGDICNIVCDTLDNKVLKKITEVSCDRWLDQEMYK